MKNKETLEEIFNRLSIKEEKDLDLFLKDIECQQEQDKKMYSEEDMKKAFHVGFNVGYNDEESPSYLTFEEWFEQFKNK